MRGAGLAVLMLSLLAGGCMHLVPPPEVPEAYAPELAEAPPIAEGRGRVVVDVEDGPTEVLTVERQRWILGGGNHTLSFRTTSTEVLCMSPCIVDLPFGRYALGFRSRGPSPRLEVTGVDVGPVPTVFRHALGSYQSAGAGKPLGIVGIVLGGMSFITGVVLLPVGLGTDGDGVALAGGVTLAAGGLLTTLGIVAIAISPSIRQPGASIQFALP